MKESVYRISSLFVVHSSSTERIRFITRDFQSMNNEL